MDRDVDEGNRLSRDRLRAASEALSGEELVRVIDPPWTAAALFAHMAFWDRFALARWSHAGESGGTPASMDDAAMDLVNDAGLPEWTVIAPNLAIEACLAAAEAIDDFIASLDAAVVSQVVAEGRPRLVHRSVHRGEHLETIATAFPDRFDTSGR
jgi:DinB superfamily